MIAFFVDDCEQVTKTSRVIQNRRLSDKRQSQPKVEGIPILYGKDLKQYENINIEVSGHHSIQYY